ncbi:MAG: ComEA family DNA-binding protein, partial [Gemmatimonadales bacterium]
MSPKERLAITSLLLVAGAGHALRAVALGPAEAPGGLVLLAGAQPGDPAAHRAASERLGRPLRTDERIDLNRASVAEIARLPKVGPGLARRMVRQRDSLGGFGSLTEVDNVSGIGPALFQAIRPHITLGDTLRVRARRPSSRGISIPPPAP